MAVKLRLRRLGRKKLPIYAIVAADSRSPRDGKFIDDVGRYYPLEEPFRVELKEERVLYWLRQGAQPSETVRSLLRREGLMLRFHLERKGYSEEEIEEIVARWKAERAAKEPERKMTKAEARRLALEEERKRVEEEERKRREAEAKAAAEAEARAAAEAAEAAAEAETAASEETETTAEEPTGGEEADKGSSTEA